MSDAGGLQVSAGLQGSAGLQRSLDILDGGGHVPSLPVRRSLRSGRWRGQSEGLHGEEVGEEVSVLVALL